MSSSQSASRNCPNANKSCTIGWTAALLLLALLLSLIGTTSLSAEMNPSPVDAVMKAAQALATQPKHPPTHEIKKDDVGFQMVSFNWKAVETPYTISLWLLLASIAKILFHVHKRFGEAIPDSALLIVVGLVLGFGLQHMNVSTEVWNLNSHIFFLYLLPPIIFDAGYFMPNRQLFENFDSVLLFAIVGTIWNTIAIGSTLLVLGHLNLFTTSFTTFEILLFAALISAVDPVAVIAVFEEIHVNEFLFVNVFGEALFNDGVTVVLYQMFKKFIAIGDDNLRPTDYLAGGMSFFVISIGGILIGLTFAALVSLVTRFTDRVKILAPVFIFVIPYLSYLTAEMFGLSSILAIVACGIAMKQYVKGNITHDASSSVKYFVKMLAQCSETVIFMFLGLSTISNDHHIDVAFLVVTVVICLIYRTIVQCAVLNRFRNKKFTSVDQFVLSYGGLRGAIAFGLVVSMDDIPAKKMFVTTCIAVIYFTVFLQGITIRPLLHWLKVEKQDLERKETMIENVYKRYCDYMMAGVEDIAGMKGRNSIRDTFERFNAKILKPILMKHEKRKVFDASAIIRAYTKIALQEAMQITTSFHHLKTNKVAPIAHSLPISHYSSINSQYKRHPDSRKSSSATTEAGDVKRNRSPSLRVDLDQYLACQENTEALYTMFSQLLDRKIHELHAGGGRLATVTVGAPGGITSKKSDAEDDIKDDYYNDIETAKAESNGGVGSSLLLPPLPNGRGATASEQLHHRGAAGAARRRLSQPSNEIKLARDIAPKNDDNPA